MSYKINIIKLKIQLKALKFMKKFTIEVNSYNHLYILLQFKNKII